MVKAPPAVKAVLFDLDGTLIDSAPDLGAAADKLRTARGLSSLPLITYRPLAGSGARGMLKLAFDMEPDHPHYDRYKEEFFKNYEAEITARTFPFEGVEELIAQLQLAGLGWGVVTNKMERFTHPIVQSMPLFATAGAIVSGDTTPHAKPHPEPLFEAAKRMGLEPAQCVYVGDDERDIIAGKAAGMWTVAANYGYLGHKLSCAHWGAHATIESPLALLQLLELP